MVRFLPWSGPAAGSAVVEDDEPPPFDPRQRGSRGGPRAGGAAALAAGAAAIAELPANQRAVLELVRFEGLSYKETAEALGTSVGAVESRLFRAMRNLEAALEPAVENER